MWRRFSAEKYFLAISQTVRRVSVEDDCVGRVLYLDDDVHLADLLGQRLERRGHSLLACSEAEQALRVFSEDPEAFDLVVTDMSMPGGSGLEFAQALLKLRPGVRVVIASGCEDPNWADFARSVGVQAVLLKPFQVDELAEAISRLLR
jgi:DNA-binding NtrC family response regulator